MTNLARAFQPLAEDARDRIPKSKAIRECANILGVAVDAVDMESALAAVETHLAGSRRGFVCAVGVHGILESLQCTDLGHAYSQSILNVPDGTPTVWLGRLRGLKHMNHVTGPALMLEIFTRPAFAFCSHFFYGGKPGVADRLVSVMREKAPWTRILGTYTPPFRELNAQEENDVVTRINALRPDIVWVGISTPRQELWMHRMLPRLDTSLMFGVGAAFDFHAGYIRECPPWVKRAGFNWLHRLVQDPKRLWRRNLNNTTFLWHIALQSTGLRAYSIPRVSKVCLTDDRRTARTCSDDPVAGGVRGLRRL